MCNVYLYIFIILKNFWVNIQRHKKVIVSRFLYATPRTGRSTSKLSRKSTIFVAAIVAAAHRRSYTGSSWTLYIHCVGNDLVKINTIGLSETAVMDLIATNLQQQRGMVDQLRREASIQRMSVSQACADIVKYVTEHEQEDCLLVGFTSQKVNPFREKSSCSIL